MLFSTLLPQRRETLDGGAFTSNSFRIGGSKFGSSGAVTTNSFRIGGLKVDETPRNPVDNLSRETPEACMFFPGRTFVC